MTTKLQFNAVGKSGSALDSLRWNTLVLVLQASDALEFYRTAAQVDETGVLDPHLVAALEKSYDTLVQLYAELEAADR